MVGQYKNKTQKEYNNEYYKNNRELINAKAKTYYHNNKKYLSEKIICMNCKGSYSISSMSSHFKTNKHLKALQRGLEEEIRKFELEEDNNIDNLLNGNI